jgi:uncharacterized membrane protein
LVWLFHRVPHSGLKKWAFVLLGISFVRLAINPSVLAYHPRSDVAILNWYLYTYGIVGVCLLVAAALWRPIDERYFNWPVRPILKGLSAILGFFLLNIQIADFFTEEEHLLTFQFGQSFAEDLT